MLTLIKNGRVCLPDGVAAVDLLLDSEKIVAIDGVSRNTQVDKVIDAEGGYVTPGFIDFHVHLDDQIGEFYIADNYKTGSKAAIQNGITTLCSFITQSKNSSLKEAVDIACAKAKNSCYCDYLWHLTPTTWNEKTYGELRSYIERGCRTVKLYTTYKEAGIYSSYEKVEEVLKKLSDFGVRVLVHCEDEEVLQKNVENGALSDAAFLGKLRPNLAEQVAIEKITGLANRLNAPVHVVHVSTVEGAKIIAARKTVGFLSCETAPQYWLFNRDLLREENGYRYLCVPPLRDESNRAELEKLTQSDIFDIYATDHCPFLKSDKDKYKNNILKVPKGLPGVGALSAVSFALHNNRVEQVVKKLAENPAKLAGIYPRKGCIKIGSDADLVIWSINSPEKKVYSTLSDCYDPYISRFITKVAVKYLFARGKVRVKDGRLLEEKPQGQCLWQT